MNKKKINELLCQLQELHDAINALHPRNQYIFLKYHSGIPVKEISPIFSITPARVYQIINKIARVTRKDHRAERSNLP